MVQIEITSLFCAKKKNITYNQMPNQEMLLNFGTLRRFKNGPRVSRGADDKLLADETNIAVVNAE